MSSKVRHLSNAALKQDPSANGESNTDEGYKVLVGDAQDNQYSFLEISRFQVEQRGQAIFIDLRLERDLDTALPFRGQIRLLDDNEELLPVNIEVAAPIFDWLITPAVSEQRSNLKITLPLSNVDLPPAVHLVIVECMLIDENKKVLCSASSSVSIEVQERRAEEATIQERPQFWVSGFPNIHFSPARRNTEGVEFNISTDNLTSALVIEPSLEDCDGNLEEVLKPVVILPTAEAVIGPAVRQDFVYGCCSNVLSFNEVEETTLKLRIRNLQSNATIEQGLNLSPDISTASSNGLLGTEDCEGVLAFQTRIIFRKRILSLRCLVQKPLEQSGLLVLQLIDGLGSKDHVLIEELFDIDASLKSEEGNNHFPEGIDSQQWIEAYLPLSSCWEDFFSAPQLFRVRVAYFDGLGTLKYQGILPLLPFLGDVSEVAVGVG